MAGRSSEVREPQRIDVVLAAVNQGSLRVRKFEHGEAYRENAVASASQPRSGTARPWRESSVLVPMMHIRCMAMCVAQWLVIVGVAMGLARRERNLVGVAVLVMFVVGVHMLM